MKNRRTPTVAVLYGGVGKEHSVSLLGCDFIRKHIDRERFAVIFVKISRSGEWLVEFKNKYKTATPMRKNGRFGLCVGHRFHPTDAIFPMLHGDFGEDGRLQGLFESLGAPLVGCKTHAGAVASDKCFTKALTDSVGIPTLPWLSATRRTAEGAATKAQEVIGFPMFVKPARLGSSVGVGKADTPEELTAALELALSVGDGRAIIEKYLPDKEELECAFLELLGKRIVTPPGKIVPHGDFYSFSEKYSTNDAFVSELAQLDPSITDALREYSLLICELLGVEGIARIDFFLSGGELYFNEINTMPGMTPTSLYPLMLQAYGIPPKEVINGLIEDTLRGAP